MKLHRVEVTNLASLYGTHSVDFEGDLRGATLFLVQGPTGSGKSTLMDGVSLALFGTTPRHGARAQPQVVAGALMSRGTGLARVSLEFSTSTPLGTRRWRATWKAARAWGRPDGEVQKVQRGLEEWADGAWMERVSDERVRVYTPVFEQALDRFTVDDFCRSMLLAQGQFDAFLRAPEDERAAILERLTDTSVYSVLGRRVAQLKRAWDARLRRLAQAVSAVPGPTPEAEAEARDRRGALGIQVADAERTAGALEALGRWVLERVRRRGAVDTARQALEEVAAERARHAGDLDALERHERAQVAFTAADRVAELEREAAKLEERTREQQRALPELEEQKSAGLGEAADAEERWERARRHLDALQGPVAAAELAAKELARAGHESVKADSRAQEAAEDERNATRTAEARGSERDRAGEAAEAAGTALAQDRIGGRIDAGLGMLRDLARDLQERWRTAERTGADLEREQRAIADERARLDLARTALDDRATTLRAHTEREMDSHRSTLLAQVRGWSTDPSPSATTADALARVRSVSVEEDTRWHQATTAARLLDAWQQAAGRLRREEEAARRAAEAVAVLVREETAHAEEARIRRAVREAHQRGLARAELAANLAEHRGVLEDGVPCPLCGSLDHPVLADPALRAADDALRRTLESLRASEQEACAAAEAAERAAALLVGRLAQARAEAGRANERVGAEQVAIRDLRAQVGRALTDGRLQVPDPADAEPDGDGPAEGLVRAVGDHVRTAAARREEARTAERRIADAERALRQVEADVRVAQTALEREERALENREAALASRTGAALDLERQRETQWQEVATAASTLGSALDGLEVDPLERADLPGPASPHLSGQGAPDHVGSTGAWAASGRLAARMAWAEARAHAWRQLGVRASEAARAAGEAAARAALATAAAATATRALQDRTAEAAERREQLVRAQEQAAAAGRALAAAWAETVADDPPDFDRPDPEAPPGLLRESQARRSEALRLAREATRTRAEAARQRWDEARARGAELDKVWTETRVRTEEARQELVRQLVSLGAVESDLANVRLSTERANDLTALRTRLAHQDAAADAAFRTHLELLEAHLAERVAEWPDLEGDALDEALGHARHDLLLRRGELEAAEAILRQADASRADRARAQRRLETAADEARPWLALHELAGRGDGKAFRTAAQALNLAQVLDRANAHLDRLCDRYHLLAATVDGAPTLELRVEDRWQQDGVRELRTLSGGETFLVSLALALGLADLRRVRLRIETLLLDEGFGTLDADTLDIALDALARLQATGLQVGVISHVQGLQERFPARVHVVPQGGGRSRLEIGSG